MLAHLDCVQDRGERFPPILETCTVGYLASTMAVNAIWVICPRCSPVPCTW